VSEAVRALARLQAAAILFNCSQPEVMAHAVKTARETLAERQASLHIGVYANAFAPQRKDAEANAELDEVRADLTPANYLRFAQEWVEQGADMVGGCCGIGPDHIAKLAEAFR
jgi:S-methylmethionine-dependent homocysteine/selenocysteine methylase